MDIIKNPVIIGLTMAVVTYLYLTWQKDKKDKKNKKHKTGKKEEDVNLLIPLVVGFITWFIVYGYFEYNQESKKHYTHSSEQQITQNIVSNPIPLPPDANYRFTKDVAASSSSEPKSFSLITSGVTVPKNLPDVMIDMF